MVNNIIYQMFFKFLLQSMQIRRNIIINNMLTVEIEMLRKIIKDRKNNKIKKMLHSNGVVPQMLFHIHTPRFREIGSLTRREGYWWILQQPGNERLCFESFRMRMDTFKLLYRKLVPILNNYAPFATTQVPVEKQVAICIYKLASAAEYRVVGDVFGVHKSTVHKYFHIVVNAIIGLQSEFIKFPDLQKALQVAQGFERTSHIPNIIGAIDGTHIPILPPAEGRLDYINRKGWASIVMQGVVDNNYKFIDVSVKHPGSTHDAVVFKESGLFRNCSRIIPQHYQLINNVETPLFLIGDPAYPLMPWLMKPYVGTLTLEEESFNVHLSSARMVVENAFGRLKGRWPCISKRIDVDPDFVPNVVLACTMMHKFVESNKEVYNEIWSEKSRTLSVTHPQPNRETSNATIFGENNYDPKTIRNNLKSYLESNFPLRSSHTYMNN